MKEHGDDTEIPGVREALFRRDTEDRKRKHKTTRL